MCSTTITTTACSSSSSGCGVVVGHWTGCPIGTHGLLAQLVEKRWLSGRMEKKKANELRNTRRKNEGNARKRKREREGKKITEQTKMKER